MTKIRLIFLFLTIIIVGSIGTFASFYAKGYRFNITKFKFEPNGILVVKSDPTGSEIYVNGDLETTSDANISLTPGTYDVTLKKEGFINWNKRLVIEKEIVTEISVSLFKSVPSLSPVTLSGSINPVASSDYTKIVYFVPPLENQATDKTGLWIVENVNLPIGFSKDPRKITDGNLINSTWKFSPDGNEVLLETTQGIFLLNAGSFTSQSQRVNIASKYQVTKNDWKKETNKKIESNLKSFPDELEKIFLEDTQVIEFSPDGKKMLYIASSSASLKRELVKPLPGTSTQKEERNIESGRIYVYDIKEDKNFLIAENSEGFIVDGIIPANSTKRLAWFPNSNNLVLAEEGRIYIMDYDGTNRQEVYSGAYIAPYAFPFASNQRIMILTNLGADSSTPNLYSLTIK
ncbi:MAG: PEGA domain-containing protein [Patescibacteria group bacterium]|nr:PEGA domain-containing protein [Patescibacteria group bacterium]